MQYIPGQPCEPICFRTWNGGQGWCVLHLEKRLPSWDLDANGLPTVGGSFCRSEIDLSVSARSSSYPLHACSHKTQEWHPQPMSKDPSSNSPHQAAGTSLLGDINPWRYPVSNLRQQKQQQKTKAWLQLLLSSPTTHPQKHQKSTGWSWAALLIRQMGQRTKHFFSSTKHSSRLLLLLSLPLLPVLHHHPWYNWELFRSSLCWSRCYCSISAVNFMSKIR